jgi:hypothetical protein
MFVFLFVLYRALYPLPPNTDSRSRASRHGVSSTLAKWAEFPVFPAQTEITRPMQMSERYCFSQTRTLLTACPWAFLPVIVPVRVFPSFEMTSLIVMTTTPFDFIVISCV